MARARSQKHDWQLGQATALFGGGQEELAA